MRSFFAATYILALSSPALAQLTVQVDGFNRITVSSRDCGTTHAITWTSTLATTAVICSGPTFWITQTICGDAPAGNDLLLTPQPSTTDRQGRFTVRISQLPVFNQTDGGFACGAAMNQLHYVCGFIRYTSFTCGTSDVRLPATAIIDYRGKPPDPPAITDLIPQDSALTVRWDPNSLTDVAFIHVWLRQAGSGADFFDVAQPAATDGSAKIGNLQNGTTYEVKLQAEDIAGNLSDFSDPVQGTPVATVGFFGIYRQEGGQEKGGCGGVIPGALSVPLAFGGYRLLRRKRSCRRDA
jgi:hypothetical protein